MTSQDANNRLIKSYEDTIIRLQGEVDALRQNSWNFDITTAPRGRTVKTERQTPKGIRTVETFEPDVLLMASVCGKVLRSYWVPANDHHDGYWAGFAQKDGTPPVAWMHWPTHPTPSQNITTKSEEA